MPANTLVKSNRKLYLDIARVLAILLVCLNHAVNRTYATYHGQTRELESIPLLSTLFKTLCFTASQFGVPLFLMISGKLILNKRFDTAGDIKHFYKNNLLRILITAEIWYVLMYWFRLLFDKDFIPLREAGLLSALWGMVKTMLFLDQITFGSM